MMMSCLRPPSGSDAFDVDADPDPESYATEQARLTAAMARAAASQVNAPCKAPAHTGGPLLW